MKYEPEAILAELREAFAPGTLGNSMHWPDCMNPTTCTGCLPDALIIAPPKPTLDLSIFRKDAQ